MQRRTYATELDFTKSYTSLYTSQSKVKKETDECPTMEDQSAVQRVLATPELIEMIFLQLSMVDLLARAQRVNQIFHSVVSTSSPIQKYLFFLPALDGSIRGACPLLRWHNQALRCIDRRRTINPNRRIQHAMPGETPAEWQDYLYRGNVPESAAILRPDASWRKMLLVQPPIKELNIYSTHRWIVVDEWVRMENLFRATGLRFSRLVITREGQGRLDQTYQLQFGMKNARILWDENDKRQYGQHILILLCSLGFSAASQNQAPKHFSGIIKLISTAVMTAISGVSVWVQQSKPAP
ncbi:hypothetical protein JHW43_001498 [Diplocarpon mali]|nr:hypothetical protein JHW43_001498 [Diplocarpon mali]